MMGGRWMPSTASTLRDERLPCREVDRVLRAISEELVDCGQRTGTAQEPVIVEDHASAGRQARIEEPAAIQHRRIDVGVDVDEREGERLDRCRRGGKKARV